MGSIQPEQMQGISIRDLPASKLPSFHISGPSLDTTLVPTHSFTLDGVALHTSSNTQSLLCRFARFVGDVVGSDRVAFLTEAPEIGSALVQAVIPVRGSLDVTLEPELEIFTGVNYAEEVDFEILIAAQNGAPTTNGSAAKARKGPFVLSVVYTQEGTADIALSLRGDYGGAIAAKHLTELAVAYLTSGPLSRINVGTGLEPSRVNFESSTQVTPQNQDDTSVANGFNRTNGQVHARLLHTAFEENVRRHPDNIAIDYMCRAPTTITARAKKPTYNRRDLTYAELDTRAKELASELGLLLQVLEKQWRPVMGDQYAFPLFISPSPELFLAIIAVLKSGHAFSSLPADAPPERLRAIIEDLGAPIVLGVGPAPWNGIKGSQFELDQIVEEVMWVDITNPTSWRTDRIIPDTTRASHIGVRVPTEDDLCYLFYTSGSTGKPKGVLGSHRAAVACVESTLAVPLSHLPVGPRVRWLNLSAPTFDPIIIDIFVPFSIGGVLCAAERDLLLTDVEACVRELRATASYAVASLALLMRPEHMPTLKTLIVGGESVNGRVIEKFAPLEGSTEDDRHLINAYGPTETTVFCTAEICTQTTRSSVIGDALSASFLLVADSEALDAGELKETPLGLAGELIVGGAQVACGYLNRPEATARGFISADKFPSLGLPSGTTLYRTGDKTRVVWNPDGKRRIDFIGRIGTDQVKLNGRRVELTEIENILTSAQGVASAAATVIKPREGGRAEIVAFLTVWMDEDRQSVVDKCRAEAGKFLPDWMCPERYTILEQLPYTASGKIDRASLIRVATGEAQNSSPATNGSSAAISGAADTKKVDKLLPMDSSSIVKRGLVAALGDNAAHSDPTTPLLNLGLDSLRAVSLLQSVREDGIEDLAMHEVLSSRTVADLINLVESRNQITEIAVNGLRSNSNGYSAKPKTYVDEVDVADVAAISADDEEALYELPISSKIRHFSHHCLAQCTSALDLPPAEIEQVLPATNTQTRVLYICARPEFADTHRYPGRLQIEHFVYNLPLEKLDPDRLKRAVNVVLTRHDCFRAVFCSVKHPLSPFAMCILNKDSERAAVPTVEIVCKFDIGNTSLWQCTLDSAQRAAEAAMSPDRPGVTVTWVRSPDGARHVMILSLFHTIFDGVLLGHLREEIAAEYTHPGRPSGIQSLVDKATTLPLLPMRAAVELLLRGTDWAETMFYWFQRFGGIPDFRFGPNRPILHAQILPTPGKPSDTHMRSSALRSSLSMDELSTGAQLQLSTTLVAVVQAAWASVLAQTHKSMVIEDALTGNGSTQHKGKLDVQFGYVLHGRHTQDAWRCMAPLLSTLPYHVAVEMDGQSKNPTNREVCHQLATQHVEVVPYIDVPCTSLDLFEMGHKRFDTSLNLQAYRSKSAASTEGSNDSTPRDLPGWNTTQNLLPVYKEIDIGFPVMMELWPAFGPEGPDWSGKMTLKCTYNVRRPGYEFLTEEWVAGMLGAFEEALVRVLREPDNEFFVG